MIHTIDYSLKESLCSLDTKEAKVQELFAYIRKNGQTNYDEMVTQYQHAVQSAHLAKSGGHTAVIVTAALLHDIGHLLVNEHTQEQDFLEEDLNHEEIAAHYLQDLFSPEVIAPIQLHVSAKRYICTTDESYYNQLSEASKRSFQVQGGFMSPEEVQQFEAEPFYREAVMLRKWDDQGKNAHAQVPDIDAYFADVLKCIH